MQTEQKIQFSFIRDMLQGATLSALGREKAEQMAFSSDFGEIEKSLLEISEMERINAGDEHFPLDCITDLRQEVKRLETIGTYLSEAELSALCQTLRTASQVVEFFRAKKEENPYPTLLSLTVGQAVFFTLCSKIEAILDVGGELKDDASPLLLAIRREKRMLQRTMNSHIQTVLHRAQAEGWIGKDVAPSLRDGRLVLPVEAMNRRRIKGVVMDESATGKTVYIEPLEVVEATNRLREKEQEEQREKTRILKEFAANIREQKDEIMSSQRMLQCFDFIQAKATLKRQMRTACPILQREPLMDFRSMRHPLLESRLLSEGKAIHPLDVLLDQERRILIISGPNAGGKSVCLKTACLLQYMLQCGLAIPVDEGSKAGVFSKIMIDIGDEQSLEDDLSTYSSHLRNLKAMLHGAKADTLLLVDEFGSGTEPQIGAAIAEAVMEGFVKSRTFAIITTHYQNLKHFGEATPHVVNGAMLYDRQSMSPLFILETGRPGSSFAIEIARKTGLPESVIQRASELVGSDYIDSDKYLQDIVRDKRYWEQKRRDIRRRERDLEEQKAKYEALLSGQRTEQRQVVRDMKAEAGALLQEVNRRIEQTIREIRQSQAEKEAVKHLREDMETLKSDVADISQEQDTEALKRQIEKIKRRKQRKAEKKANAQPCGADIPDCSQSRASKTDITSSASPQNPLEKGDLVRMDASSQTGTVETVSSKRVSVLFGDLHITTTKDRLTKVETSSNQSRNVDRSSSAPQSTDSQALASPFGSPSAAAAKHALLSGVQGRMTRETIDRHRSNFKQEIDVRGMRGDEALRAVMYFIDDATIVSVPQVRILHGKGNGILRQLIRDYLATVPQITNFRDENVQFGGAGITVVEF